MAKSQETFNKKEKEKNRLKKRQDKQQKKEERRASAPGGGLDSMMAYVDENGQITDTPPDLTKKKKIKAENIEIGIPKREELKPMAVRTGKVIYFNDQKGYGFIKEAGTEDKYFVHANGLLQPVAENDNVSFELERGMKGMNAVRVKMI
jgi:cold shock CspA family protein